MELRSLSHCKVEKPSAGEPRSDRDVLLNGLVEWLGYPQGRVLKLIKGRTPNEIRDLRKKAEAEGKVPKALFQYLLKNN